MATSIPPALRLNKLRQRANLSLEKLAHELGFKRASSIQRYESEEYFEDGFLPLDFVRKLADVLPGMGKPPITPNEVWNLAGIRAENDGTLRPNVEPPQMGERGRSYGASSKAPAADLIPCYGDLIAHDGDVMHLPQEASDLRQRPVALAGVADAYMLMIAGESMQPKYNEGILVHVNPHLAPRAGRGVVVHLSRGRVMIKEYVQQKPGSLVLREYNPQRDLQVAKTDIKAVHTIVGTDET